MGEVSYNGIPTLGKGKCKVSRMRSQSPGRKAGHPCRGKSSDRDGRLVPQRGADHFINLLNRFLSVREGLYKIRKKEN